MVYLRREWQARVFGDTVARASEHPVQLRRQNCELAHVNGNNNITVVDLGREGVVWFRQFLGRGRNGMWHDVAALFGSTFLVYVEPKLFFFFCAGKFWSAAPINGNSKSIQKQNWMAVSKRWCGLNIGDTVKHEDWNLVFANHGEEDEIYPLTTVEIAEAQMKDQNLKIYYAKMQRHHRKE